MTAFKALSTVPISVQQFKNTKEIFSPQIFMGINETEIRSLSFSCAKKTKISINCPKHLSIQLYKTPTIASQMYDPLVPITSDEVFEKGNHHIILKVTSSDNSPTGKFPLIITSGNNSRIVFKINIKSVRITRNIPIQINANCKLAEDGEVANMLSDYKINGFTSVRSKNQVLNNVNEYKQYLLYLNSIGCAENIKIPTYEGFSSEKDFESQYGNRYDKFADEVADYINSLSSVINDPILSKKYIFTKFWDEPTPEQFDQVFKLYSAVKKKLSNLNLDVSRYPDSKLDGPINSWTISLRDYNESEIKRQRKKGNKCFLYANRLHGLDKKNCLNNIRAVGWLLWNYELDGYYFWKLDDWNRGDDVWADPPAKGNDYRRGCFLYPYNNGVITSLRLEFFKKGIEDIQIVEKLKNDKRTKKFITNLKNKIYHNVSTKDRDTDVSNIWNFHDEILSLI